MYRWIPIEADTDFEKIAEGIPADYAPTRVIKRLKEGISLAVRAVLVEQEYVDKDYRSTYYHYYAKKGREYRTDCVRLHFFDALVKFDAEALLLSTPDEKLDDHYFGYMVLRPTLHRTIGRTVLSPDIRRGARGFVITARHKVHLLGYTLHFSGFPSMDQHEDISVCSHAACWAILRHYSERFAQHREILLHGVTMLASRGDPGGLSPSDGLIEPEAERIFRAAGTYPVTERKDPDDPEPFYRHLLAYLESGFPLYLTSEEYEHALVCVGHKWRDTATVSQGEVGHAWDRVESVLVVDDHHLPYLAVPAREDDIGDATYTLENIDALVVALPEKIFFRVDQVERTAIAFFRKILGREMALPADEDLVVRYFVTTAPGLREYAQKNRSAFGNVLVNSIMRQRMAQFVWIVEFASVAQWNLGIITARAVMDATASAADQQPFWFAHDAATAIFFDRSTEQTAPVVVALPAQAGGTTLPRMERNLRPVKPSEPDTNREVKP